MHDHITGNATLTQIEIIVSPTGQTSLQTKGFTGSVCRAASLFMEQALGQRASETLTTEFHQKASADQVIRQQG